MSGIEIISAILLIISCVFIIVIVLMQESKRGMSQTLTGASADNYFQKNSSRTKEARLKRATRTAAILFFVVTIAVNVATVYFKNAPDVSNGGELEGGAGLSSVDIVPSADDGADSGTEETPEVTTAPAE